VGSGVTRCVGTPDDMSVALYLSPDAAPFNYWSQTFTQDDEPTENYCGPTAGMNFLSWYGIAATYQELGQEMHTNTWDTGAIVGAAIVVCGLDPVCATIVSVAVTNTVGRAGSLPGDVGSALLAHLPPGYVFCLNSPLSLDQIHRSLVDANPIVMLVSAGSGNLHWEVITGLYKSGSDTWLRIANADDNDLTWPNFQNEWSLSQVGDSTTKGLLNDVLGIGPNVSFRWETKANVAATNPFDLPVAFCP